MTGPDQIQFREVAKSWPGLDLLERVNLTLERGTVSILGGDNGSGKTTLLRIFSGLEKPDRGQVALDSRVYGWRAARKRLLRAGMYLHQDPYLFEGTVLHNLALCLPGLSRKAKNYPRVNEALEWGMLTRHAFSDARTLSGGQRQRVALARAWLQGSAFLYLDEPIASMDSESSARTLELLSQLKSSGAAILVCTHNTRFFDPVADRHYHVANRTLEERGPRAAREPADNVTYLKTGPDPVAG